CRSVRRTWRGVLNSATSHQESCGKCSYNDSAKIAYDRDHQKAGSPGARCRSRDKPEQSDRDEPQECQFNEVDHHPVALPSSRTKKLTGPVATPVTQTETQEAMRNKLRGRVRCSDGFGTPLRAGHRSRHFFEGVICTSK